MLDSRVSQQTRESRKYPGRFTLPSLISWLAKDPRSQSLRGSLACIVRIYEAEEVAVFTRETTVCTYNSEKDKRGRAAKNRGGEAVGSGCDAITAQTHCFISEDKENLE